MDLLSECGSAYPLPEVIFIRFKVNHIIFVDDAFDKAHHSGVCSEEKRSKYTVECTCVN